MTSSSKKVPVSLIVSSATFSDVQEGLNLLFEGPGSESALVACMLRVHFEMFDATKVYLAKTVGGVDYVPYKDKDMKDWCTKGHADEIPAWVARLADIDTLLIQAHSRMPRTTPADIDVFGHGKIQLIPAATSLLSMCYSFLLLVRRDSRIWITIPLIGRTKWHLQ